MRRILWLAAATTMAVGPLASCAENENVLQQVPAGAPRLPVESRMPALEGATTWFNTQPLAAADLRGKVVLVDFWTYTCINWLRTAPHVRAWARKYADQGLVVIGVHTPEFSFEKRLENVRRSVKDFDVDYPVAVDNDYAVWDAFGNRYWPALYFVDAQGDVRHHHFGEGEYEQAERVIQQLLAEAGHPAALERGLVSAEGRGVEVAADWDNLRTPETYLGYARSDTFASQGGPVLGQSRVYAAPARLRLNQWALSGDWTMEREFSVAGAPGGRVAVRFHARDVHLVMGTGTRDKPLRFRVLIDGQPPGASRGVDVDDRGRGTVIEPRLYQLIRQPGPIADRLFEIEFLDAGAAVFAFTFG